jgi:hypothetical protein
MAKLQIAALLALFAVSAVSAADSIFNKAEAIAQYNEKLQKFESWNETTAEPMSRRKGLGIEDSSPVTVTFYNSPGMDCTTGKAIFLHSPAEQFAIWLMMISAPHQALLVLLLGGIAEDSSTEWQGQIDTSPLAPVAPVSQIWK